jgi:hypothetical protein
VGSGHRGDDREAEPRSRLGAYAVRSNALERLGEPRHAALVEDWARALDDRACRVTVDAAGEVDEARRLVVQDGVLDDVLDHARQQRFAAGHRDRFERGVNIDPLLGDPITTGGERFGDELIESHWAGVSEGAILRVGQGQEALQQTVGTIKVGAQVRVQRHGLRGNAIGLGHRHVERGTHHRQRGTQLVRSVRHEPPLRIERRRQPGEQLIDGVRQLPELILRPRQCEPIMQPLLRDAPRSRRDRPQR